MTINELSDLELEAWRGFLLTHERLRRELESGLAPLNVSMAEYNMLAQLREAGSDGMRMSDLAEHCLMTTGGFTRLADRLEHRGLIERRRSTVDRRSVVAILTPGGQVLMRRAWNQHRSVLREHFFDRLDDVHLRSLVAIWTRLNPPATSTP